MVAGGGAPQLGGVPACDVWRSPHLDGRTGARGRSGAGVEGRASLRRRFRIRKKLTPREAQKPIKMQSIPDRIPPLPFLFRYQAGCRAKVDNLIFYR